MHLRTQKKKKEEEKKKVNITVFGNLDGWELENRLYSRKVQGWISHEQLLTHDFSL
jgi:hypothetical protein